MWDVSSTGAEVLKGSQKVRLGPDPEEFASYAKVFVVVWQYNTNVLPCLLWLTERAIWRFLSLVPLCFAGLPSVIIYLYFFKISCFVALLIY